MAEIDRSLAAASATGPAAAHDRGLNADASRLLHWFATLTPATLADIGTIYSHDCHFKDPFNEVRGVEQTRRVYAHMFATTGHPRFVIGRSVQNGPDVDVFWRFQCIISGRSIDIAGMSALHLNEQGLIADHVDYWDSAEMFACFPLLGGATRWLKRRLALPATS